MVISILFFQLSALASSRKDPVDYVNTSIGGMSILLSTTNPYVQLPHDYPQVAPLLNPGLSDSYLATKIYGFPAGPVTIMPSTGATFTDPDSLASDFDRDFETRTPYFYETLLENYDIESSFTAGHFAVFYDFAFPKTTGRNLNLMINQVGSMRVVSPREIEGRATIHDVVYYVYMEVSQSISDTVSWRFNGEPGRAGSVEGENIGLTLKFAGTSPKIILVKAGISLISIEQAKKNLDESISGWDFARREKQTRMAWNDLLGKIEIRGGSEKEKSIFYSSLYRAEQSMTNITEDGKYYSSYDHKVHDSHGRIFYVHDQLWDTFRCEHPLQLLLDPGQQEDIVESYIRMYEQGGWLPMFPQVDGDFPAMIGQHADALIADTYLKGYTKFDVRKAYEGMKKGAMDATMLPWRNGPMGPLDSVYLQKGFFPALKEGENETDPRVQPFERRQAVSVTLEAAYDDWCVARMAKALGKDGDYNYFIKRAHNYVNVFDSSIGFMAPKSADGRWVKGFNPILASGPGGRDYFTECNSWIYTFSVMHDIAGLIDLFGGRKPFLQRLDSLFEVQYGGMWKYSFLGKFPDMTGLIGNYAQGNEPSFHIPYIYDFAGEPWKTQKLVREIMEVWYNDIPLGLPGDDDLGAMGSWYVFSAMGFYPFCPGEPCYVIGSPVFASTTIHLSNRKTFRIVAHGVSVRNKYIQSARLNGKPLNRPWFTQMEIANGGVLELNMGPRPNKTWGAAAEYAPESMSNSQ